MTNWIAFALLCCGAVYGEGNLLKNPGFEAIGATGMPIGWAVFVMQQDGALGQLDDDIALEGQYSVRLYTPLPYEVEPINNWSQNIMADLAGKEVMVRGHIRVEDATEAAIWLQCWRKRPFGVIHTASTWTETPVYGTRPWTPLEMLVKVPEDTDFVTLRCVLKGAGAAWFDSMSVRRESLLGPLESPGGSEAKDDNKNKLSETILETHAALLETNKMLREMNELLATQVEMLQEEVEALRADLNGVPVRPPPATMISPDEAIPDVVRSVPLARETDEFSPRKTPPPIVPHGYYLKPLSKLPTEK